MTEAPKRNYIDAARGWAILLVITAHVGGMLPLLPWPVKKLTNFGVHGVQLFFLASAVTLLMSWHRSRRAGRMGATAFFIRRFLRIAPMYYSGALIYFIAEPPAAGFDFTQLLTNFAFVNAWSPDWMTTTDKWAVVPGGWSIGVEFTFYALFPLLVSAVTSLGRAWLLLLATIVAACAMNGAGLAYFASYRADSLEHFLYFWFPNQAPVFAAGTVLYFLLDRAPRNQIGMRWTYAAAAALVASLFGLAESGYAEGIFHFSNPVTALFLASLGFAALLYVLGRSGDTLLTHWLIRRMGVLSFSGYVLHFLFVHALPRWTGGLIDTQAKDYAAIGAFVLLWVLAVPLTFAASALAHRWIEQPGIDLAHRLTAARVRRPETADAV